MFFFLFQKNLVVRDVAKVFNRRESSNDRRVFGPNFEMQTLGDAFSLILGAKSRAFVTDFYQVTANNKVMINWSVDCF